MGQVPAGLIRLLVGLVTLCALGLLPTSAHAATAVGMCADTAQSIEAPPPLYPSDGASLSDCDHFDLRSGIASAPLPDPQERIWSETQLHQDLALLPSSLVLGPPPSKLGGPAPAGTYVPDEHRSSLLRPPCV